MVERNSITVLYPDDNEDDAVEVEDTDAGVEAVDVEDVAETLRLVDKKNRTPANV